MTLASCLVSSPCILRRFRQRREMKDQSRKFEQAHRKQISFAWSIAKKFGHLPRSVQLDCFARRLRFQKRYVERDSAPAELAEVSHLMQSYIEERKNSKRSEPQHKQVESDGRHDWWANIVYRPWRLLRCVRQKHRRGQSI